MGKDVLRRVESIMEKKNQSVENTCVAFAKGAIERNEFFEKINKR